MKLNLDLLIFCLLLILVASCTTPNVRHIENQITNNYGEYRLTHKSDFSHIYLKLKTNTKPVEKIDINSDGLNDYIFSILTPANNHLILLATTLKNGHSQLTKLYEAKPDRLICSSWKIKNKGETGFSARKYFYYNFKKHPHYKINPQSPIFNKYVDAMKRKYKGKISIEVNLPLNTCSQTEIDDLFYSGKAFFYDNNQLRSYNIID